jgi:hypothetical protein
MNAIAALKLIATTTFKPFDESDWQAFAGCKTDKPMIGESEQYVIVIDGDECTFADYENGDWFNFKLNSDGEY